MCDLLPSSRTRCFGENRASDLALFDPAAIADLLHALEDLVETNERLHGHGGVTEWLAAPDA